MSTHMKPGIPAAPDGLNDNRISDRRAGAPQEFWQALQERCVASRPQANHLAAGHMSSNSRFTVLTVLSREEPMTMGRIREQSDLPTPSRTALVDRLVELRIVRRFADPSNRRAIQVQHTEDGRDLARRSQADTLQATSQVTANPEDRPLDEASGTMRNLLTGYEQYVARFGRRSDRPPRRRARADRVHRPDAAAHTDLEVPERAHLDAYSGHITTG